MKKIILIALIACSHLASCQNIDTSEEIEGVTQAWKQQDIVALKGHLDDWSEIDPNDPALAYAMIYYHFGLVPDKQKAIQACDKLKLLGEECKAPELIELAEEKKNQILAIPDAEFIPHPNEQLVSLMALAPEGPPFISIALTFRKYRKLPAELE